jgi:hypothetical protein
MILGAANGGTPSARVGSMEQKWVAQDRKIIAAARDTPFGGGE